MLNGLAFPGYGTQLEYENNAQKRL